MAVARTYWKIRLNHNRLPSQKIYDYTYLWTEKPLSPREIPLEAVKQKMLLDVFLSNVDQVRIITKEEYLVHMWE